MCAPLETFRNICDRQPFGAFVDVGAERDGFIHVSDISTEFIHQPSDMLRSGRNFLCSLDCTSRLIKFAIRRETDRLLDQARR